MFPLDVLSEPVWQRLTWTLLHFLWQGLAVAVAAATLLYVWPVRRAQNRYLIHLCGLIAMVACPLVTFMVVEVPESMPDEVRESAAVVERETDMETEVGVPLVPDPGPEFFAMEMPVESTAPESYQPREPSGAAADVEASAIPLVPVTGATRLRQYVDAIQPYAMIAWMAGVLLLAMRLSLSWFRVRWLAWDRRAIPTDLAARVGTLSERIGLTFPPHVCTSEKVREAIVVGLWRPLVLLPASWLTEMTPEVLEAVIAHELAHVRRFDLWVNLLQRLVETLLFYHPAVWWLSRRLSVEREMCADELAVGATSERLAYATALEQLGRMRLGRTAPQLGAGIGGKKMALLDRVGNILGTSPSNRRARWWPVALLALAVPLALCLATAGVVSSTENDTRAEEVVDDTVDLASSDSANGTEIQTERADTLRGDADKFEFSLEYRGEQDKPYLSLLLEGPATPPRGPLPVGWTGARLSEQQVLKLIELLKTEGFLESASDVAFRDMAYPKGPTYTLIVRGPEKLEFYEDLGWDLKMIRRLDAMAAVLEGDAAEEMEKLITRLSGHREKWQTTSAVSPTANSTSAERSSDEPNAANPLGLDDGTLITFFSTGKFVRRVAFDCEAFYDDRGHVPKDVPELASRYQERSRDSIGMDPFAPGKKLRLILDKDDPHRVQVWSVGPDRDWDGGKRIDSTSKPLDGDLGVEIRVGQTGWHWLADETMQQLLKGERLAHYLAAKGPKLPKPDLKDDGFKWGPVVDGLQLAVELSPKKEAYLLGETIDVRFHVRNAADYVIQVGLAVPWRQDLTDRTVLIHDENGKSLKGKGTWFSGTVGTKQYVLKPGETASYESCDLAFVDPGERPDGSRVGYWVEAAPGVYTAKFKQHFPIGFVSEPREWRGTLETAPVSIRVAEHPKSAIHQGRPSDEPSWGKAVEGVKSRLQAGEFRDGYQWVVFELSNDSSALSVQLGPNGRPNEIIIDAHVYEWGTGVAGSMPVCKPGKQNRCEFKLDENWMPTKMVSGPETLKLKPGKHTVQAAVYATGKDGNGRDRRVRVLSNPVEIEISPSTPEPKTPAVAADDENAVATLRNLGERGARLTLDEQGRVTEIRLSPTWATATELALLEKLPKLQRLAIERIVEAEPPEKIKMTEADLAHLQGLTSLRYLTIRDVPVSDASLSHFAGLKRLEGLTVGGAEITDAGFEHIGGLTNLFYLYVTHCAVTDAGLERLKPLTRLKFLTVRHARITDAGLAHLNAFADLRTLDLSWANITDAGLAHLEPLDDLRDLRLSHTRITDAGLKHLKGLTGLIVLNLIETHVTAEGAKQIQQALPSLKILRCSPASNATDSDAVAGGGASTSSSSVPPWGQAVDGLRWRISLPSDRIEVGKSILVDMEFQNTSDKPLRILKTPTIDDNLYPVLYTSDGNRDMYTIERMDQLSIEPEKTVLIEPGETYRAAWRCKLTAGDRPAGPARLKVSYFSPKNTNPDVTDFWSGRLAGQECELTIVPHGDAMPERKPADAGKTPPTPEGPDALMRPWEELGVEDQATAYRAVEALCATGDAAVKLAAGKLDLKNAGPGPFPETVDQWRLARAIRMLELIESDAAKDLLTRITTDGRGHWPAVFAQAALKRLSNQPSRPTIEKFGVNRGLPIYDGFLFFDGEYMPAPYVVERWGVDVYINGVLVERGHDDILGVAVIDQRKARQEARLRADQVIFDRTRGGEMSTGREQGLAMIEALLAEANGPDEATPGMTGTAKEKACKVSGAVFSDGFKPTPQLIERMRRLGRSMPTRSDTNSSGDSAVAAEGQPRDAESPATDLPPPEAKDEDTVEIELELGGDRTKAVSVALGQSAADIYGLCRPAKVYADDDPWLAVKAAGGGAYVLFFAAEGTPEEMRGRLDAQRDKLYAVLRYPADSKDNGTCLLPGTKKDGAYGDFVTLRVPLGLDKAKVATVLLGMSTEEVKQLFPSATDHADEDHAVVFDSVHDNQYLLLFTPNADGNTHDPEIDKLSEVIYRYGDKPEVMYFLPRDKRGEPVAAEHRELLGLEGDHSGADTSNSTETSSGTTPDSSSESEAVKEARAREQGGAE